MSQNSNLPINLDHFDHPIFRKAVQRHVHLFTEHFGDRLISIYVRGSVHRNEAVEGVSDLDLYSFIKGDVNDEDMQWRSRVIKEWDREHEGCKHGFNPPWPVMHLEQKPFFKRLLRYDTTLVWGQDLVGKEEPTEPFIVGFGSEWRLARFAAGIEEKNTTDFRLPDEPPLRLRKLARMAVLVGATFVMHKGCFRSFKGSDILPVLKQLAPQWMEFIEATEKLYIKPIESAAEHMGPYLSQLLDWMSWVGEQTGDTFTYTE